MERKYNIWGFQITITDSPKDAKRVNQTNALDKHLSNAEIRKAVFLAILQSEIEQKLYHNFSRKMRRRNYFSESRIQSGMPLQKGLLGLASDYLRGEEQSRGIVSAWNSDGSITSDITTKHNSQMTANHYPIQESVNEAELKNAPQFGQSRLRTTKE